MSIIPRDEAGDKIDSQLRRSLRKLISCNQGRLRGSVRHLFQWQREAYDFDCPATQLRNDHEFRVFGYLQEEFTHSPSVLIRNNVTSRRTEIFPLFWELDLSPGRPSLCLTDESVLQAVALPCHTITGHPIACRLR